MLTLQAQLGDNSLTVDVDRETGVITLPPDTILENGRWLLSQDGTEIGAFDVTEGVVGTAYSTRPRPEPRMVIIDLSFIGMEEAPRMGPIRGLFDRLFGQGSRRRREEARQPRKTGIAATLERELYFSEFTIRLLDGSTDPCPGCGQVHTMNEVETFSAFLGGTPDMPRLALEHFRTWARETNIELLLQGLATDANSGVLSEHGYSSRQGALTDLERLQRVLAWQPKQPASAPAAEASGESASQ